MRLFVLSVFLLLLPFTAWGQVDTVRATTHEIEEWTKEGSYGGMFGNDRTCSLACALLWNFDSTSHLEPQSGNTYTATNLADTDPNTAWVEGEQGYGIGSRIVVQFEEADFSGVPFYGLAIHNGYAKDTSTWQANGRVHHLRVWHDGEPKLVIELADTMDPQKAEWETHLIEVGGGETVELEVLSVYPGKKFADIAITNINLFGAH